MLLTSVERVRRYIGLNDTAANNAEMKRWIPSCSRRIETYCDRLFEKTSRTEYFNVRESRVLYFLKAIPIASITSIKVDTEGLFDGGEFTLDSDEYCIGNDSNHIVLQYPEYASYKGIQVVYVGGMALSGTQSVFAITGVSGTWTVSKYAVGGTSGAVGIVRAASATSITIENLYGIFEASETITEYDSETAKGGSDATATISSITSQSLAESQPDITTACEIEVRYSWKHKHDFENVGSQKDSTSRRDSMSSTSTVLQPESIAYLQPYKRPFLL